MSQESEGGKGNLSLNIRWSGKFLSISFYDDNDLTVKGNRFVWGCG